MLTTFVHTVGQDVRDVHHGTLLGCVDSLVLDPGHNRVAGAVFKASDTARLRGIELGAIHSFGRHGLMVLGDQLPTDDSNLLRQHADNGPLIGKSVVTRKGEQLGAVRDICFDCFSGELSLVVLSGGPIDQMLHGVSYLVAEFIQTIGPEFVVVKGSAADAVVAGRGGLSRFLSSLHTRLRSAPTVEDGTDRRDRPYAVSGMP